MLAAGAGLEPASSGSEPKILPLDDPAQLAGRVGLEPTCQRLTAVLLAGRTPATNWSREMESNHRRHGLQPCALPLSYRGAMCGAELGKRPWCCTGCGAGPKGSHLG